MSLYFTSTTGGDIFLNLSREDRTGHDTLHFTVEGRAALKMIRSAKPNVPLSAEHLVAADTIYDSGICISPYSIFQNPIHRDICIHFNGISDFGWSLREALDAAGASHFIEKVKNRSAYDATMERILAVFTMSVTGLSSISEAPSEFIHAVVDFFRTSDGADWNREILGVGDVTVQCVSNVIKGLAQIFNDDSLLQKARKHRRASVGKNPGFFAFQYSKDALDQELLSFFRVFVEDSRMKLTDVEAATQNISAWLKEELSCSSVREIITNNNRSTTFTDFLKERNGGQPSRSMLTLVNAARKLSVSISEQLSEKLAGQTMFDLVSAREVQKLQNQVKKLPKPDSIRARPLAEKLVPILREILEEGAAGWPGTSGHFDEIIEIDGRSRTFYCPVIPALFLVMLDLPLRMGQIRRLDTGEGDSFHFNADRMEWEPNDGPLAGYWKRAAGVSHGSTDTRGYAREIQDELKPITGINVSTNKTGKPYVVPWYLPKVQKTLWNLRKWQEKHNPITTPITPAQYVDSSSRTPAATLAEMPDIFPISRLFRNKYNYYEGRVVTYNELHRAWGYILLEIERRWNNRHPANQVNLVEMHPISKQPCRYRYTIHGLRVRGLTNLRRGGMPLDMLSKFVAGHATLRMTIYYTEPHPIEVADAIERAVANADAQRQFIDDLRVASVDRARDMTVSLSPAAVSQAYETESQFQFCNVSIGVCPFDGSRCHDGGDLLRKEEKDGVSKNIYGKVERRNCVMCRHFLSGPPWLSELTAYGTKLCERRQFLAREQNRIVEQVAGYEEAYKAKKITKAFFENQYDSLQAEAIQVRDEIEINENSIFNVELLCNASRRLLDDAPEGEKGVMLVAHPRSSVVEFQEVSEFKQSVWITAFGRIHQILGDERVEMKRDRYLDLISMHSGLMPPTLMTRISSEHRRRAMDQYALFVDARASDSDIARMLDGTLRLQDLGLQQQVRDLIDTAISSPIPLAGVTPERALAAPEIAV